MGPCGRSRAAFYSRSCGIRRDGGAACIRTGCGAISVTIVCATRTAKRAHTPSRGSPLDATSPTPRATRRRVETRLIAPERKQDPTETSRQGDHRDAPAPTRRRGARPTRASVPLPVLRQHAHAAWTSRLRSSRGPALVMCPRCRRSAELSSRGTSPIAALTWPRVAKPRHVIDKRAERQRDHRADPRHRLQPRTTGSACAMRLPAAHRPPQSRSSASRPAAATGRRVSASAGGQRQPGQPRRHLRAAARGSR